MGSKSMLAIKSDLIDHPDGMFENEVNALIEEDKLRNLHSTTVFYCGYGDGLLNTLNFHPVIKEHNT